MKIYLSGIEVYADFVKDTVHENFFVSFYTPKSESVINLLHPYKKNIIVDSGAFSFISQRYVSSASNQKSTVSSRTDESNLDAYVQAYCEYIDRTKDKVFSFVELDVDMIFGKKKVLEIREKLYKHAGKKLMVCYHSTMGPWEQEKKELFKYDFVGIEGIHAGGQAHVDYMKVVKDCYEAGKFVHIFAMTKKDFLSKVPTASTDSTSWGAIMRYGRSTLKKRKGIQFDQFRDRMRRPKAELKTPVIEEVTRWNGFEKYFTDLWKMRGIDWDSKLKGNKV